MNYILNVLATYVRINARNHFGFVQKKHPDESLKPSELRYNLPLMLRPDPAMDFTIVLTGLYI